MTEDEEEYEYEEEPEYVPEEQYGPPPRPRHTRKMAYSGRKGYISFPVVPYPQPTRPFKLKPMKIKPVNPFKDQYRRRHRY